MINIPCCDGYKLIVREFLSMSERIDQRILALSDLLSATKSEELDDDTLWEMHMIIDETIKAKRMVLEHVFFGRDLYTDPIDDEIIQAEIARIQRVHKIKSSMMEDGEDGEEDESDQEKEKDC